MSTQRPLAQVWFRLSRVIGSLLLLAVSSGAAGGVAAAAPSQPPAVSDTISPATATQLATAMGVPPGDLVSADLLGSAANGVGVSDAAFGDWFPTGGDGTFAILATGLAADADQPNSTGSLQTQLSGLNNDDGWDLVRLHLQLTVPADANCLTIDYAFYSEEFPEYVGSEFNDAFVMQVNDSSLIVDGAVITAPHNIALDSLGNLISVNNAFGVFAPTGTTYDGVTPLLRTTAAVTPSTTVDLYFSITDLGDSIYDSAVFVDGFRWLTGGPCHPGTVASARIFLPVVTR